VLYQIPQHPFKFLRVLHLHRTAGVQQPSRRLFEIENGRTEHHCLAQRCRVDDVLPTSLEKRLPHEHLVRQPVHPRQFPHRVPKDDAPRTLYAFA